LLPETISAGWRNDLGENGGRVAQVRRQRGAPRVKRTPRDRGGSDVIVGELLILYPSGQRFTLVGTLRITQLPDGLGAAPQIIDGARVYLLDPRAVVLRDGGVVADPRSIARDALAPWVREWLDEHPEWPRVATEVAP